MNSEEKSLEWKRKWFDRHQNRPFSFQKEQRQTNVQMDQKRISQGASGGRGVCGASPLGSSRRSKSEAPGSADAPSQHAPCLFPESRIPGAAPAGGARRPPLSPLRGARVCARQKGLARGCAPRGRGERGSGRTPGSSPLCGPWQLRHVPQVKRKCRFCGASRPRLCCRAGPVSSWRKELPALQDAQRRPWRLSPGFLQNGPPRGVTAGRASSTAECPPEARSPLAENHRATEKVSSRMSRTTVV